VCTAGVPARLAIGNGRTCRHRNRHGAISAVVWTAVALGPGWCSMVYVLRHKTRSGGLGNRAGCKRFAPYPSRMILTWSSLLRVNCSFRERPRCNTLRNNSSDRPMRAHRPSGAAWLSC